MKNFNIFYNQLTNPNFGKESFSKRALYNFCKNYGGCVAWFLNDVALLAKGISPKSQNEYEAAKRIAIGTITGKYHQKALALKGITIEEFQKIKENSLKFIKKPK